MPAEGVGRKWTVAYVAIRLLFQTGQLVLRKDTRLRLHHFGWPSLCARRIAKVETVISRHVTARPNRQICRMWSHRSPPAFSIRNPPD
jgi:hypothetical protein